VPAHMKKYLLSGCHRAGRGWGLCCKTVLRWRVVIHKERYVWGGNEEHKGCDPDVPWGIEGEKKKVDLKHPEVIGFKWIEVTIWVTRSYPPPETGGVESKPQRKWGFFCSRKSKGSHFPIQAPGWPKDKGSSSQRERHWQRSFKKDPEGCGHFRGGIEEVIVTPIPFGTHYSISYRLAEIGKLF